MWRFARCIYYCIRLRHDKCTSSSFLICCKCCCNKAEEEDNNWILKIVKSANSEPVQVKFVIVRCDRICVWIKIQNNNNNKRQTQINWILWAVRGFRNDGVCGVRWMKMSQHWMLINTWMYARTQANIHTYTCCVCKCVWLQWCKCRSRSLNDWIYNQLRQREHNTISNTITTTTNNNHAMWQLWQRQQAVTKKSK